MRIAFLVPGYGSQFIGMGKELYDSSRLMQEMFEEASGCLSTNFVNLCFAESQVALAKPENAYPAITLVAAAISKLLEQQGIKPDIVTGYGIGIFGAAFIASSLNLADSLYISSKWAHLYSGMLEKLPFVARRVWRVPVDVVRKVCLQVSNPDLWITPIIVESPEQCIVLGHGGAMEIFLEKIRARRARTKRHSIFGGVYLPVLEEILPHYHLYFPKIDFKDPKIPLVAGLPATQLVSGESLKKNLLMFGISPFSWFEMMVQAIKEADCVVVPFPDAESAQHVAELFPEKKVLSITTLRDVSVLKSLQSSLSRKEI